MMFLFAGVHVLLALVLAPLLLGVINRVKALAAGRRGQPLAQPYFDLLKLARKGAVYSRTTTWVVLAAPLAGLGCVLGAVAIVPLAGRPGLVAFPGDLVLLVYLLGMMRLATVFSALDTGSSFEGMGASREVLFSALAEPALLLGLATLAAQAGSIALGAMYAALNTTAATQHGPAMLLVAAAFLAVFLTENARIPVDDPNTHLELTMIHEVMILDHGGPDLALILYGAALKMWVLGTLLVGVVVPIRTGVWALDLAAALAGLFGLAVLTGLIESGIARLKLLRVPQFIVAATVLSVVALILVTR